MKNKLDKNAKTPSGKSKEIGSADSNTPSKPKSKSSPAMFKGAASAKVAASEALKQTTSPAPSKLSKPVVKSKAGERGSTSSQPLDADKVAKSEKFVTVSKIQTHLEPTKRKPATKLPAASGIKADPDSELSLEEFSISILKPGESKERIWRTKKFHQLPAQREFGFPEVAPELPSGYSQSTLVLMPKDPEYMFCYWELAPSLLGGKETEKMPNCNYRETLKINWESKSLFEPNFTFIPVFFWARKWYFGVPQIGQSYQVELGWLSDTGHFISIIRSNLSELPESWAATQKRLAEQGEVLAYSSIHTKTLGASENLVVEDVRAFIPEWNLSSESMSSSSWSRGPSDVSAEVATPVTKGTKSRSAIPKAQLEVSGKVLPGTQVLVGGNAVKVDKQGNFKTEFPYNKDILKLELSSRAGVTKSFTYDLKELVLN